MSAVESQITSILIVCSTICSGADQRKHQSSAALAFGRGIHRWPVNSPHKGPVTRKMFPFDDGIMCILCVAMVSNTLCFINTLRLRQNGCHFTCDIFKITDKWNWQYNRSLSRAKFGVMNNMYKLFCNWRWTLSMASCKKDVTPLLAHWSYSFLALTHQICDGSKNINILYINIISVHKFL